MLKKIVLGTLCIGFIGILIYGAILRTDAKTSSGDSNRSGSGTGPGRGRVNTVEETEAAYSQGQGQDQGAGGGQAQGNGGRGQGDTGGEQANGGITTADWLTFEGAAVTVNSMELVIEGDTNEPVLVDGRAWAYALEQGADVQVGNVVIVTGFIEDGEFKVISLENLTTGQRITVRDTNGRPLWSGGERGDA